MAIDAAMAAPAAAPSADWVPVRYTTQPHIDLRASKTGPKGYKTVGKRKYEALVELGHGEVPDVVPDMEVDEEPETSEPASKRRKVPGEMSYVPVGGRVPWKQMATRAAKVMGSKGSMNQGWEKKMADKAAKKQFTDMKKAAEDSQKAARKAKALARKTGLERKKANQLKSQIVQKITKASTVKKMMKSKKQRKLLKTADTN